MFWLSKVPTAPLTAEAYWNGAKYNSFGWGTLPYISAGFHFSDPALGYPSGPGTIELRIFVGGVFIGSISASVSGSVATATPTPTRTPTPYVPPIGTSCLAVAVTWDWELCVREGFLDLFEIRVTALTESATESSFKVRVYAPGDFFGADSSTKYPFYVGQTITLDYGFDFFEYGPYLKGLYEIELRVDFFHEASVFITVY